MDQDEEFRFSPENGRRLTDRETPWKVVTLILTLVGLIFTAGYNWRRVEETATAHQDLLLDVHSNYVRKDVAEQQLKNIDGRLEEIRQLVQRIERQQGVNRRE